MVFVAYCLYKANYVEIVEQPEETAAEEPAPSPPPPPPPPPVSVNCESGYPDADVSSKPPPVAPAAPPRPPTPEPAPAEQGITAIAMYEYVHVSTHYLKHTITHIR
jgi:hypothetical protein